jgi:hypothetical protein
MSDYNNIEVAHGGLKCDADGCDWSDDSIPVADYEKWINRPCPKCGANLLTLEDFQNAQSVLLAAALVNGLSPEEIEAIAKAANPDNVPPEQLLKDIPGAELIREGGPILMQIETHKEVKIAGFKKDESEPSP